MKDFIEYECEDNDIVLRVLTEDDQIDQIWVGVYGTNQWTPVSYTDLLKALHKADLAIVKAKRKTKE
jgi:hypothetical protein